MYQKDFKNVRDKDIRDMDKTERLELVDRFSKKIDDLNNEKNEDLKMSDNLATTLKEWLQSFVNRQYTDR